MTAARSALTSILLVAGVLLLGGCGQKGPLTLSEPDAQTTDTQAGDAQSTAEEQEPQPDEQGEDTGDER